MSRRNRSGARPTSAAKLLAELKQDPAFLARQQQQEADRLRRIEGHRLASTGVLADLAAIGCEVETVGDLRKLGRPYPEAVPVLVRWLPDVEHRSLKEDIVRTLSVPWAGAAAGALVLAFERAEDATGCGLRWAIGNALEVLARDVLGEGLIRLATDRRYGKAREMIVVGLGKLKDARVVEALLHLLGDEEVVGHAVMALGRFRARRFMPSWSAAGVTRRPQRSAEPASGMQSTIASDQCADSQSQHRPLMHGPLHSGSPRQHADLASGRGPQGPASSIAASTTPPSYSLVDAEQAQRSDANRIAVRILRTPGFRVGGRYASRA